MISIEHLYGSNYHDTIKGNDVYNNMAGRRGDDSIEGRGGNDRIYGGVGDDVINGGSGDDALYGEEGADRFVFGQEAGIDTIHDFNVSEGDVIDLADVLFDYDPLSDAIGDFVQITDDGTHSTLSVDSNGGGDTFSQIISLQNVTGLTDVFTLELNGTIKTDMV